MPQTESKYRPILIKGPEDAYIIKNHPVSLSCKALYAEKISFKCNDEWVFDSNHENRRGVDDERKVEYLNTRISIHKREVEEYFGTNGFSCQCYVYGHGHASTSNSHGHGHGFVIKSEPAIVRIAHLKKHFAQDPVSDRQPLGGTVHIPCLPPDGEPRPEVFWLKDDNEIDVTADKHMIIAHDGSLIISISRLTDTGRYVCGVRNLIGQRLSQAATITIYVDGQWSEWSEWSGFCPSKCSVYDTILGQSGPKSLTRIRRRQCSRPTPINDGRPCEGLNVQHVDCAMPCFAPDGHWSQWTEWSQCYSTMMRNQKSSTITSQCASRRSRQCLTNRTKSRNEQIVDFQDSSCLGRRVDQIRNCTGILSCPSLTADIIDRSSNLNGHETSAINLAMLCGLGAAITVFLFVAVILALMLLKRKNGSVARTGTSSSSTSSSWPAVIVANQSSTTSSSTICRRCTPIYRHANEQQNIIYAPLSSCSGQLDVKNHSSHCNNHWSSTLIRDSCANGHNHYGGSLCHEKIQLPPPPPPYNLNNSDTKTATLQSSVKSDRSRKPLLPWPKSSKLDQEWDNKSNISFDQHHYAVVEEQVLRNPSPQFDLNSTALINDNSFDMVHGTFNNDGGHLRFKNQGICLYVPPDYISSSNNRPRPKSYEISISSIVNGQTPNFNKQERFLTPAVSISLIRNDDDVDGNNNDDGDDEDKMASVVVNKPFVLTFPHCASNLDHWRLHVWTCNNWTAQNVAQDCYDYDFEDSSSWTWQRCATLGEETLNTQCYVQRDDDDVYDKKKLIHLMVDRPTNCRQIWALSGEPNNDDRSGLASSSQAATVRYRFLAYLDDSNLKIFVCPDLPAYVRTIDKQEQRSHFRLIANPESCVHLQPKAGCQLVLQDVQPQWIVKNLCNNLQYLETLATDRLCNETTVIDPSFSFKLQKRPEMDCNLRLKCKILVQQFFDHGPNISHEIFLDSGDSWNLDLDVTLDNNQEHKIRNNSINAILRSQLERLLNAPLKSGNDWRLLAKLLKFDHYLPFFASRPSPTDLILSLWQVIYGNRNGLTHLKRILYIMHRNDAIKILQNE